MTHHKIGNHQGNETEERRRNASLRENIDLLNLIFDEAPIGAVMTSLEGAFIKCNTSFCHFLGYSAEELTGKSLRDVSHAEDMEICLSEMQAILSGREKAPVIQKRYLRKDSTLVWGHVFINLLSDPSGRPLYFLSFVEDITEKKRLEDEARRLRDIYQAVIDKADALLVYLDRDFNFLMVNAAYAASCKKAPEELLGRNHFEYYPHEENEKIFKQVRDSGRAMSFKDKPFEFPDQPERGITYWDWTLSPVLDSQGEVQGLVYSLIETTDRRCLEKMLEIKAREWQGTFDATNDAIWILDKNYRIVRTNKRAAIMFQSSVEDLIGRRCWEVVHQTDQPIAGCPHMVAGKTLHREKLELRHGPLWFEVTADPLLDETGHYAGVVHIISDITERKNAEEKLHHQKELLSQMGHMARIGGWELDPATGRSFWTDEAARIHDLDSDVECNAEIGLGLYTGESRAAIEKAIREALEQGKSYDLELELISAKGVRKWIHTIGYPVREGDQIIKIQGSFQDITVRKEMETEKDAALQALREQELQYHHLADAGPALIWTSGTDKLCTYFNEPWLKFTGRTLEQEVGNGWAEGVHPDDLDRCVQTYNDKFDRRQPFDMEYRLRDAAGDYRWIRDLGTPNYDSRGEFLGYIGHCFDITHQKEAAEAVEKLNRDLEQKVNERTRELQDTVNNLEELNRVFIGRELRMAELKARIAELEQSKNSPI